MDIKNYPIKILFAVFGVILSFNLNAAAQTAYNWLEAKPLPSWSERSRAILQTKKISPAELKRCSVVVRPPTLAADRMATKMGWTLVGDAQVFGRTTAITVAESFDGMCRPLGFQTLVFVGNRVAGTMSPGPMNSRTDGALTNVKIVNETTIVGDYVRYAEKDALCCPSKMNKVSFKIEPDGQNWLLKPEYVTEAPYNVSETKETLGGTTFRGTVWRWESAENSQGKTSVDKPENYQIEFTTDSELRLKADCNGGGNYKTNGGKIEFTKTFTTKKFCGKKSLDTRFLQGLARARTFAVEGDAIVLTGADAADGAMRFFKVTKQN